MGHLFSFTCPFDFDFAALHPGWRLHHYGYGKVVILPLHVGGAGGIVDGNRRLANRPILREDRLPSFAPHQRLDRVGALELQLYLELCVKTAVGNIGR